jgi:hypothetical protein
MVIYVASALRYPHFSASPRTIFVPNNIRYLEFRTLSIVRSPCSQYKKVAAVSISHHTDRLSIVLPPLIHDTVRKHLQQPVFNLPKSRPTCPRHEPAARLPPLPHSSRTTSTKIMDTTTTLLLESFDLLMGIPLI